MKVSKNQFIEAHNASTGKAKDIQRVIKEMFDVDAGIISIHNRLKRLRAKGMISLESGNQVSSGETLIGSSTMYDAEGKVKLQWVKTNVQADKLDDALRNSWETLAKNLISPLQVVTAPIQTDEELLTLYPFPDLHLGMLAWGEENGGHNYDLKIAKSQMIEGMKYLLSNSPNSKTCIIADLGDVLHADDFSNSTQSGHVLDMDARFHKTLALAQEVFIRLVEMALEKHEKVVFIGVPGNHSVSSCYAIHSALKYRFIDNPRFEIDDGPQMHKYYQHGKTLLGFTHGHTTKPARAGSVMIADNIDIISETIHREFHLGHFHSNKIELQEESLCTVQVHKNMAPNDAWAQSMGYRSNHVGEVKSLTYSSKGKKVGTSQYTIDIDFNYEEKEQDGKS